MIPPPRSPASCAAATTRRGRRPCPAISSYRGIAFSRHRFTRPEGRGDTFAVELGEGPRVLVLCAHHDAVPGSPGANDNAAAVGILLHLIPRLPARIPRGWRVRLLFTAAGGDRLPGRARLRGGHAAQ